MLLCFVLPAAILLAVYAHMGMAPFGDRSILAMDMADQYVDFFCALKEGDVFFSWGKAMGSSYIGVFSYYVSSPLSALTLLVPNEHMPMGLMGLTLLKLALAGLSFGLYHRKRLGGGWAGPLFACCYALMSYAVGYSMCIMWLDGLIWLPLILLGMERLLAGRGAAPFTGALVACFVSSWYISWMIGGFCCLYFAFRAVCLKWGWRELRLPLAKFLLSALFALGLTAWLWLPSLLSMLEGKLGGAVADYAGLTTVPLSQLLSNLLPGRYDSLTHTGSPLVYCGLAVAVLAILYFFCGRIPLRERLAAAGVVGVLAVSMLLSPLDKVWHLFLYPNWFLFRYSFLFSFTLICLAARALPTVGHWMESRTPRLAPLLLALLTVWTGAELGWNARAVLEGVDGEFGYQSYSAYAAHHRQVEGLVERAREDGAGRFFRMAATTDRSKNEPLAFGYPGLTHYSSIFDRTLNATLKQLGFAQGWMWSACYGSTVVTDALFSIGYTVSPDELSHYERVSGQGELSLWKNPHALPLAFVSGGTAPSALSGETALERQNGLLSALSGWEEPVFVAADAVITEDGAGTVTWTVTGTGEPVYGDFSAQGFVQLWVDGQPVSWLDTGETRRIHHLGTPAPGETLTVTVRDTGSPRDWAALCQRADLDVLEGHLARLDSPTALTMADSGRVEAALTVKEGGLLVTSIPAQAGWTARVDGARVDMGRLLDTFLTVELPRGARTVELRYTAPGLIPGMALGALSLLLWAGGRYLSGRKRG